MRRYWWIHWIYEWWRYCGSFFLLFLCWLISSAFSFAAPLTKRKHVDVFQKTCLHFFWMWPSCYLQALDHDLHPDKLTRHFWSTCLWFHGDRCRPSYLIVGSTCVVECKIIKGNDIAQILVSKTKILFIDIKKYRGKDFIYRTNKILLDIFEIKKIYKMMIIRSIMYCEY